MTGESLNTPELQNALAQDPPDLATLRRLVVEAYNIENETRVESPFDALTEEDAAAVVLWLRAGSVAHTARWEEAQVLNLEDFL